MLMPSPNTFRKFWDLGYRRLLPIAPPDAQAASGSALERGRGKAPGVMHESGFWTLMTGWNTRQTSEDDLEEWNAWHAGTGIVLGPQPGTTQQLYAIDADTLDFGCAQTISQVILAAVPGAPVRVGQSPKALYLVRVDGDGPEYSRISFKGKDGATEHVELLNDGRQFVAAGVHPKTKSPYTWPNGILPLDEIPLLTPGELAGLMSALKQALPEAEHEVSMSAAERARIDQSSLKGDLHAIREAMENIPNDFVKFPRTRWLTVAHALRAALPDHIDEAVAIWLAWCEKLEGRANSDERDEEIFRKLKPPFGVGAKFIYRLAERYSDWRRPGQRPEDYFQPVNDNELDVFSPPKAEYEDTFELLDIDQILALPDPRYVVDRHFPEQSLGFLYGDPGSFKSFIALDAALHLAHGLPDWHGDRIDPDTAGLVIYLAGEGAAGFKQRIASWLQKHCVPEGNSRRFALMRAPCNFMSPDDIAKLERTVARRANGQPVAAIVVDTVSRAVAGADQNLQKDMTIFIKACDRLKDRFKAVVLGVHHTNKSGDILGSVVFRGSGDFVFRVEARKEGAAASCRLTCEKQKDGPDGWGESYALEAVGASLVPRRLSKAEATKVVSAGKSGDILAALDSAWREGRPWRQRGVDNAVTIMMRQFGMPRIEAEKTLQLWVSSGTVTYGVFDKKAKLAGYRLNTPNEEGGVFD